MLTLIDAPGRPGTLAKLGRDPVEGRLGSEPPVSSPGIELAEGKLGSEPAEGSPEIGLAEACPDPDPDPDPDADP